MIRYTAERGRDGFAKKIRVKGVSPHVRSHVGKIRPEPYNELRPIKRKPPQYKGGKYG